MKTLLMALVMVGLMAGPALAFQCPLLVKQINDETAFHFDEKSSRVNSLAQGANWLAVEAMALHEAGKHDEAMARMKEAAKLVGLTLQIK